MTSGSVTVDGHDIATDSYEARKKMGYMPEQVPLYPEMRVVEYLTFRAELKRVPRRERRRLVDEAMRKAHVDDVATRLIGHLSKGYRQRVGLADALVANPPILILDEPTAGLDPNQIREVRNAVRELGRDHTILLSTHILSEVEQSCGRVILIAKGKVALEGPTHEIRKTRRSTAVEVTVRGDAERAEKALKGVAGLVKVERVASRDPAADDVAAWRCVFGKKVDAGEVGRATEEAVNALVAAGLGVREVRAVGSSLEEIFAALTEGEGEPADAEAAAE
jgi:gliding motility-associated transport system ATP-binding protein